jgi:hypothetical protein
MNRCRVVVLLSVLCVLLGTAAAGRLAAEVVSEVEDDVYVLPVAELASTKTYPDMISIRNELIQVELVPNRGRILLGLKSLTHGVNFLHRNLNPDPMVLSSGLFGVEFGGYYLSLPWNTRDRQPFDLKYEVKNPGPDEAEVYLSGTDMFVRTLTECWVRLKDGSPLVDIEVSITNTSKRSAKEFDFRDYSLFSVETPGRSRNTLLLPADNTEIIRSQGDWLGSPGSQAPWGLSLQVWGRVQDFYEVETAGQLSPPCVGVYYPELQAACVKSWKPGEFFSSARAWAWGEGYQRVKGSGPYFGVSTSRPKILLEPGEKIGFHVYFAVIEGLRSQPTLEDLRRSLGTLLE